MLRFESLEMVGFKSFADKLPVTFDDRITAVIGPNGCGKSNLFDAIGWVLGAQSARNLRGERMDDVIFSGTAKRKPSGLAQVSLKLRREGDAPLLVQGKELTEDRLEISRRLYRDGESQYLINQRRCRLKDIHQVLEEAGLGYASYALIAQGKIDTVLTGKPADRRAIIEEAARIANFKSRRRSAEVKLEMAQQNLLRVNDIVVEVERSLRSLKRQAAKARRYQEIKLEFRRVQVRKFALESQSLQSRLRETGERLEELRKSEAALQEKLAEAERDYRASVQLRDRLEGELEQLRQRRSDLLLEIQRAENSLQYHREQVDAAGKALRNHQTEQKAVTESLEQVAEEVRRFESELAELRVEEERAGAVLSEHAERVARRNAEISEAEAKLEELRDRLLQLSAETASLSNLREQLQQRLQDAFNTRRRLNKDEADFALRCERAKAELERRLTVVDRKQETLRKLRERLESRTLERRELESEREMLRGRETESRNQLIAFRERLQSLQEVEISRSQYSEGTRKFLNHLSQSQSIRSSGTLADRIETAPQFERLVEEFLDQELEYVLVDSMDEAVLGVGELKGLKAGRCTFLSIGSNNGFGKEDRPSSSPPAAAEQGVFGSLGEILQMDADVGRAFRRVLPQQADAIVVSDLDRAFNLAHSHPENLFITLEGETLAPRGLLSAATADSKKLGLLSLKRQKKQLEKRILQEQRALAGLEQEMARLDEKLEAAALACEQDRQSIHQVDKEAIGARLQMEQAESDLKRHEQARRVVGEEMRRLREEEAGLRERYQRVEADCSERTGRRLETEQTLAENQKALARLKDDADEARRQYHQVAADQKVLEERRLALKRTLERIDEQRRGLEGRREASRLAAQQNRQRIETMTRSAEESAAKLETLRGSLSEADAALEAGRAEHQRWKESHPRLESRVESLRDRQSQTRESRAGLEIEKARSETQLQSVADQCLEQLQEPLEEVVSKAEADGLPLDEVVSAYNNLRQRLDSFGPVNMTALEEYQESEERFHFLTGQRADIEASIADTLRAIQDLNRRSKEKFQEAFEAVNRHFQEFFQKLFGGGECGIQLLDEDDVLESGLDIYAQPPGKKLQNVMLLSGGEKALTVLALLFGLFAYRPSQFCVLDEVDAPLDDANVIRFTTLIREMSEKTQLILITHNKRTMEIADSIYGVTMAEPGISQVVSAKL